MVADKQYAQSPALALEVRQLVKFYPGATPPALNGLEVTIKPAEVF